MPSASVPPPVEALNRERIIDPDFWLGTVCWTVVGFSVAQILLFSFGRDQSIYAVVADGMLRGQMPYRDVWDFKPPGIFFVYALAAKLFGKTMLGPRLLEAVGLVLVVFAFRRLGKIFFGIRRVGLIGGALAALIHAQLEFWHTGQPETFGGYLTVAALLLAVGEFKRSRRWLVWSGVGVLFGLAFLLKPPLGGGAIVCAAYFARSEFNQTGKRLSTLLPFIVVGGASVLPIALCGAWFYVRGAWPALYWTLFEFTPGYTRLGWSERGAAEMFYWGLEELFFRFSAVAAFGFIAALVIRPMHSRERQGLFLLLGVISIHLAGIAMQGKFFQYHYAATLPLLAFLAGLGLYKLWRRSLMAGASGVVAYFAFILVAGSMRIAVRDLGSFWERSLLRTSYLLRISTIHSRELLDRRLYRVADYNLNANRQVALEVARLAPADQPVFVWGFEPGIYWLADRVPASRFVYDVPQRVQWERARARRDLLADLERQPPAAIVVQHGDRFTWVTGDRYDSAEALDTFPELARVLADQFERKRRIEDFDVYVRKPQTVGASHSD